MGKVKTLTLPLIITRGMIVFPGNQKLVEAGRKFSINAVNQAKTDSLVFLTAQKNAAIENPKEEDIYTIGTLCRILSITERENAVKVRIEVVERVRLENTHLDEETGSYISTGHTLDNPINNDPEVENAYLDAITSTLDSLPSVVANMPKALINQISKSDDLIAVLYSLAAFVDASAAQKQELLEINDTPTLFTAVMNLIKGEETKSKIESDINEAVRKQSDKAQKEYFLREKLKAIKKELGENPDDTSSPDSILEKLEKEPYPENVKKKVKAELKKFEMMPQGSLEAALIQSYVDVLMNIPWYQKTEDDNDLKNVERILDEDHYGLDTPKKRIVEYLAVKKLTGNLKSPILCFYGPPGTGKTSLGKSIARALGRKFFKCSLGGISDEAEIRGHRRTYVGSMPGRIIQGMRKAGVSNPVFLLDEVDKLASSYKGDPASALLEVLDPEQNNAFNDNYVEEPYDLSDVLFICTANYLENVPGPLRDRLELIELSSYTELEKLQIAKNHLVKKQTEINGLTVEQATFDDEAIMFIIQRYTRESGVRELERKISSCLRKVAVSIVKDPSIEHVQITIDKVREYLGVEIFDNGKKEAEKQIGVVTGLAYTQFGGDILPIEVNYFKGKGGLVLTGKLGDVMKESATIALDYVKANAEKFKIDSNLFAENDIHIHVPEGAVPKDGPSAGVAMTCAIISCLSGRPVNPDVAMTGEVTLRGNALPIGGLREKSLAALRSGIKTIIVPNDNKKDVEELPQEVKDNLKIVYMKKVEDAIAVCLTD